MKMEALEYPKKFKDNLGRIVYIVENEFERIVLAYYGDTNLIKIKYHYFNNDSYVDVFSKSGTIVFSTISSNVRETKVEKKNDGTIEFIVNPQKLRLINSLK